MVQGRLEIPLEKSGAKGFQNKGPEVSRKMGPEVPRKMGPECHPILLVMLFAESLMGPFWVLFYFCYL